MFDCSPTPRVTYVRAYHRPSEGNCYPYFVTPPPIILVVKSLNEISVGAMLSLMLDFLAQFSYFSNLSQAGRSVQVPNASSDGDCPLPIIDRANHVLDRTAIASGNIRRNIIKKQNMCACPICKRFINLKIGKHNMYRMDVAL